MSNIIIKNKDLIENIKKIIHKARYNILQSVNKEMLLAYFEIGKNIIEGEQYGKARARYGKNIINILSKELTREFGKGFDVTYLRRMRRFYLIYQKWETVSPKLSWSHYSELIKIEESTKRIYFEKYAIQENLSVRDLKRLINSFHYERLLLSKDKKALLIKEKNKFVPRKVEEAIKDPYVLEFLNLDERYEYTENELETKILDNLQHFLLELGQGFSFVARQKRITIDNEHYYIDLLFYNIPLKCYVVIELKSGKFKHEYAGQMNFYLNYVENEIAENKGNKPIGIILCSDKNKIEVKYTLLGLSNRLFVSKYKLFLPKKKLLERKLKDSIRDVN